MQQQTSLHLPPGSSSPRLTDDQFFNWGQAAAGNASSYPDPAAAYNATLYHGITGGLASMAQATQTPNSQHPPQAPSSPSNQVARRSTNQSLVSRGPRAFNSNANSATQWQGDFGDSAGLELQGSGWISNSEEQLEQRALIAKREAQAKRKQIPPFVQKLSSFLDQSKNTDLIRWSDGGDSFIVLDEDEFAKTLIPELFKHNNYASFVRQLNMYGFHKKVGLSDNSMKASERKNKSPSEYHNPYFKRGHPDLLWLINKPKNSQASNRDGKRSGRKGAVKAEEGDRGSDDDGSGDDGDEFSGGQPGRHDVPRIAGSGGGGAGGGGGRGLTAPGDGGVIVAKRELANVQSQIESIRQHQKVISTHINRLRKDHNQLYEQAVAFQTLHDRHESSINAILTFLATVYNRSLEGHGGQNFANMFGNAIPHDTQGQGNVVDVGDADQGPENQVQRRFRRQPLMLTAPPNSGEMGRVSTVSPAPSSSSAQTFQPLFGQSQQSQYLQPNQTQTPAQSGAVEELFDPRSSGTSPSVKPDIDAQSSPSDMPQRDILSIINSANATNNIQGVRYDFPSALSHYETSNGNSPLTPKQRNAMLHLIANSSSASGTNNALLSPTPPPVPSLDQFGSTQQEIDMLARLQAEQDAKVQNLANMVQPLSPTGEIPGLTDGQYYNGQGLDGAGALDLDQIFNSGDYFSNHGNGDMDFVTDAGLGDGANIFDGTADGGDGGTNNNDNNRIVESLDSSESASPPNTVEGRTPEEVGSPSKRRRRGRF
ncbi:MAG: Heat shock factor protein 2 [Geoglossum umbratile]|nr:MAG: Heat shock factor protein 2 [Geoglossum umbratile]